MIVVEGNFDPITETELVSLKELHKKYHTDIFVQLKQDGVLSYTERRMLCDRALKPYRHLYLMEGYTGKVVDYSVYQEEEKEVRSGLFRKAAYGTRKEIFLHGLYFQETAKAMCNPHRYVHSIGVAETASKIAAKQGVDPRLAYQAGLLHDITKAMPKEESEAILERYRPEWLTISDKIWHSFTAVIWMKQNMGLYDTAFLNAIEHHTLGDGRSKLCLILYIADKIEPGRGYDTTRHMELACADLQACSQLIHAESKIFRETREGVHE
jgi:predicted HD superfamily hydrolase involved in NAD metabolism